jgi:hypothetical protein
MRDAAKLAETNGEELLQKMIADLHIPPDLEHYLGGFHLESRSGEKLLPYEAVEEENYPRTYQNFILTTPGRQLPWFAPHMGGQRLIPASLSTCAWIREII